MAKKSRIPLSVKLLYTVFATVMIPVYWFNYGPTNFLYFCDVAVILTFFGVWLETSLLSSMCAVGILLPQALWVADFVGNSVGFPITGMTNYMFQADHSLFLRSLSFFHGWLPFFLIYLVSRLGHDSRALKAWTVLAWVLLFICYFLMPPPTANPGLTPVNINYVWGMSDNLAQSWVPSWAWFTGLLIGLPLLVYWPTNFILVRTMPRAANE